MKSRHTRYQAAIVREHHILLLWYEPNDRDGYWLIPGSGREAETEEECVIREAWEETNLQVKIERLILDEQSSGEDAGYSHQKTYLCSPLGGEPSPGVELELEGESLGSISRVHWFDLRDVTLWCDNLLQDRITYPQLANIRLILGYS